MQFLRSTITVSGNWEGESIVLADVADNVTNVTIVIQQILPYESLIVNRSQTHVENYVLGMGY